MFIGQLRGYSKNTKVVDCKTKLDSTSVYEKVFENLVFIAEQNNTEDERRRRKWQLSV